MSRRRALLLLGAVGLAGGWYLLSSSGSSQVRRELEAAAKTVSAGSASGDERQRDSVALLRRMLADGGRVVLAGDGALDGPQLEARLGQWLRAHPSAVVTVEGVGLRDQGATTIAEGELGVSDSQAGDLHRVRRRFSAELERGSRGWVLRRGFIGEPLTEEPEPRP
ncbi:MAG: hypothetical protein R3B13_10550 [Polyangiaceae bacterium]